MAGMASSQRRVPLTKPRVLRFRRSTPMERRQFVTRRPPRPIQQLLAGVGNATTHPPTPPHLTPAAIYGPDAFSLWRVCNAAANSLGWSIERRSAFVGRRGGVSGSNPNLPSMGASWVWPVPPLPTLHLTASHHHTRTTTSGSSVARPLGGVIRWAAEVCCTAPRPSSCC